MSFWPDAQLAVARILKINQAGENGAISIYRAQIAISRWLYPDLVAHLEEMLGHEIEHFRHFSEAMHVRRARPCRLMWLSTAGGTVLGSVTALAGRRSIWATTAAVEDTVHRHLEDQLRFLVDRDPDLFDIIAGIREEEVGHLRFAESKLGAPSRMLRLEKVLVSIVTEMLIYMSTSGDSARMRRDLDDVHSRKE
ncbi:MAG: demethoxyubiquinone hydroxylase family protein [Proteobacteria bacterium]|nr:demethoxyubiquinone hydroxylase family protein [Pseudomonadota bacterium]